MLIGPSLRPLTNARPADMVLVDANGDPVFGFDQSRPGTGGLTSVPASATSVTVLAANAGRRGFVIANESNKTLFIAFGPTASLTSYTVPIAGGQAYTGPLNGYTGIITGIWESASGNARVTELTA